MNRDSLHEATLEDLVAEIDRLGQIEVLKAEVAEMPVDQQEIITDVIRGLAKRNRLADFPAQPGCVHEGECLDEWVNHYSLRHHWPDVATVDLGGATVTITPSVMIEPGEPVKQEHVELDITVEDSAFVKDPISLSVEIQHVEVLIRELRKAIATLPAVCQGGPPHAADRGPTLAEAGAELPGVAGGEDGPAAVDVTVQADDDHVG